MEATWRALFIGLFLSSIVHRGLRSTHGEAWGRQALRYLGHWGARVLGTVGLLMRDVVLHIADVKAIDIGTAS